MRIRQLLLFASCLSCLCACVPSPREGSTGRESLAERSPRSIEGYWQDAERRVLFARNAPSSAVYGKWVALDQEQTYPLAKHVRKAGPSYELIDLNYDSSYGIKVVDATDHRIRFVRSPGWGTCRMHHDCRLEGAGLFCALENRCQQAGADVVDWQGEERYVRRWRCERVGRTEAQGIPVRCQ